jgi:hypothetical protein
MKCREKTGIFRADSSTSEIGCLDKLQAFNSLTVCANDKNFLVRSDMCLMVGYIYSQGIFYCTKSAMEHFNKRQMKIYIYARFRNLNKLKLIYPKRKTEMK